MFHTSKSFFFQSFLMIFSDLWNRWNVLNWVFHITTSREGRNFCLSTFFVSEHLEACDHRTTWLCIILSWNKRRGREIREFSSICVSCVRVTREFGQACTNVGVEHFRRVGFIFIVAIRRSEQTTTKLGTTSRDRKLSPLSGSLSLFLFPSFPSSLSVSFPRDDDSQRARMVVETIGGCR